MSGTCCWNRPTTCAGSAGAPIVTTARASGNSPAAHSTAAPPRLWPIKIAGAWSMRRIWLAAATRSATLDEKPVLANSPSLAPSPVKSKRSTAMPRSVRPSAMRLAARLSLPQVKQWANNAKAVGVPPGRSSSAESFSPRALGKSKRSEGMACSLLRLLLRYRNRFALRRCGLLGVGLLGFRLRVRLAVLPDDRAHDIRIVVGPDALARVRRDDAPVRVFAERGEIRVLARTDDGRRGKDVVDVGLVVARRAAVDAAGQPVRVRDTGDD